MSKSKIVKASFVAMSDIRKEIKTIDPKDPKIINSLEDDSYEDEDGTGITEELVEGEAIDDEVIDGSTSMILENAQEEADLIVREAGEMAEQMREEARQQGFDMGYNEGVLAAKEELAAKNAGIEAKETALEEAYQVKLKEAEPQMAQIINDLVNNMVGHYSEDPDVIIFLIRLALSEITTFGSFILKVSPEDFDYVIEHKNGLTEGFSNKMDVEVLRDNSLSAMDCLIETDYGNVDASLALRLNTLSRELKLIGESLGRSRED